MSTQNGTVPHEVDIRHFYYPFIGEKHFLKAQKG
jgi:hypothetical protein